MNGVVLSARMDSSHCHTISGLGGSRRSHSDLIRPSSSFRKRSLSPTTSGISSNNDLQSAPAVPFYIGLLENLTFHMDVTKHGHDVRYVLHVRRECKNASTCHTCGGDNNNNSNNNSSNTSSNDSNSGSMVSGGNRGSLSVSNSGPVTIRQHEAWNVSRSFDEYRQFQQRVIKLLNHGHFCSAECPWLYTFLTSYFPRNHMFRYTTKCVIASRQAMLQKFFQTFQLFLCTKQNQTCGILVDIVAKELVSFLYGDLISFGSPLEAASTLWQQLSLGKSAVTGGSSSFDESQSLSEEEDATNSETSSSSGSNAMNEEQMMVCTLCDSSLHEEANSGIKSMAPMQDPGSVCRRFSCSYITRLGCGHLFHDECIVPKLNESMHCPTCGHQERD